LEYARFPEKSCARDAATVVFPLLEWHDRVLRTVLATLGALATAIFNRAFGPREQMPSLRPGDRAPDFSLRGSDGRVHRLADHIGRSAVVLAWFPKAFTGG